MLPTRSPARDSLLLGFLLVTAAVAEEAATGPSPPPSGEVGRYVGSEACRDCHADAFRLWASSRHARSVLQVDGAFVARCLTPQADPIDVNGAFWRAELQPGSPKFVRLSSSGRAPAAEHELRYAVGGVNVYFFLTLTDSGRWQVLPLAYDVRGGRWYATMASMLRHHAGAHDLPLEWTDPAFTWNAMCVNCHVSQPHPGYSAQTNRYRTHWLETGVNCETCHGPCGRHVEVARTSKPPETLGALHIVQPDRLSPRRSNDLCASCHALAAPLTGAFRPGEALADHYDLTGLENDDFFPDGQSRAETYTHTSFLLSKCASEGELTCSHCHTPSGRPRWTGTDADRMCAPCHAAILDDVGGHTHHAPESEGSRCVACHLPRYAFARIGHHEHSMLPPAPRLSLELGTPNACNLCHGEHDAAWAEQWVRRWYPRDYQAPLLCRARLIAAARKQERGPMPAITAFIADRSHNDLFRASLLRLLGRYPGQEKWPVLIAALKDPSVWVRAAAAEGLAACPQPGACEALAAAAEDTYRVVRMQAAFALSAHRLDRLPADQRSVAERALHEFESLAAKRADHPTWQVNLGIVHQNRGQPDRAVAAYEQALTLRPTDPAALVNLSLVYAGQGRLADSEQVLLKAVRADPDNTAAQFNLGLLYGQTGRLDRAEQALRRVLGADPDHAAAAFNLAVILAQQGRHAEALVLSRQAATLQPANPRYQQAVIYYESKVKAD